MASAGELPLPDEPLINALAKIAQWKGAAKDLEPFYN